MLVDFFCGTGISRDAIFCSSLPGNDVNEKISDEVKKALKESAVNIAILSHDYYQSAYCLRAIPEKNAHKQRQKTNREYPHKKS